MARGFPSYHSSSGTSFSYESITVQDKPGQVQMILRQSNGNFRTIDMTREQANALAKLLAGGECYTWHNVGTVR